MKVPKILRVPVSERTLIARINLKLAPEGQWLRKKRRSASALGAWSAPAPAWGYYAVDFNHNTIIADKVDLESWGKELGVLKPYERLTE